MGDHMGNIPGERPKPRRRTWIWVSAVMTLFCGGPVAAVIWGAMAWSDAGKPEPVDCADAMEFARGTLPASARDARCTSAYWQETRVEAEFRMERGAVEPWLAATYPDRRPGTYCAHQPDLCVSIEYGEVLSVTVGVTYEDGHTVLVRVGAFDH